MSPRRLPWNYPQKTPRTAPSQLVLNTSVGSGKQFIANPTTDNYGLANNASDGAALGLPAAPVTSHTGVAYTTQASPPGFSALSWNGISFLDAPNRGPSAVEVWNVDGSGQRTRLNMSVTGTVVTANSVTQSYAWGSISTTYAASGDDLDITIVLSNTQPAGNAIYRYWLYPLALALPSNPTDTSNTFAFSVDTPASAYKSFAQGDIAFLNNNVAQQMGLGWWQVTSPPGNRWFCMLYVDPTQNGMDPNWPATTNTVSAGSSVTMNLIVRFATPGNYQQTMTQSLATAFTTAWPQTNTRPPLKPLARLSFTGSFRPFVSVTNPRGWFNDSTIDVTTPAGVTAFQTRLLAAADQSIAEIQRIGAQGAIVWDIEGQETDQSYIGDPSQAETLAPELVGVLDAFVAKFTAKSIPIGFTLRPQSAVVSTGFLSNIGTAVTINSITTGSGFPSNGAGVPGQVATACSLAFGNNTHIIQSVASPTALTLQNAPPANYSNVPFVAVQQLDGNSLTILQNKVQYCVTRWGATAMIFFYVDTSVDWNGNITPAADFETLETMFPGVWFIPEWKAPRHYRSTYPWNDPNIGEYMPSLIDEITYPTAYGVVRVPNDSTSATPAAQAQMLSAVLMGSVLLADAWYRHPANDVVIQIYGLAAGGGGGGGGGGGLPGGTGMTLAQMYTLVERKLSEYAPSAFYPQLEIVAALNEAERMFVLLTLILERTALWYIPPATPFFHMLQVTPPGSPGAIFPDWIVPLRITSGVGAKIRPARLEDLSSLDAQWPDSPGYPTRYVRLGVDLVAIYPQPTSLSVASVTYARSPALLVNDADVPEIPSQYHFELVNYAVNRMRQVEGAAELAKTFPLLNSFLDAAQKCGDYVRAKNRAGQYDILPFELSAFDRSQLLRVRADMVPSRTAVAAVE